METTSSNLLSMENSIRNLVKSLIARLEQAREDLTNLVSPETTLNTRLSEWKTSVFIGISEHLEDLRETSARDSFSPSDLSEAINYFSDTFYLLAEAEALLIEIALRGHLDPEAE